MDFRCIRIYIFHAGCSAGEGHPGNNCHHTEGPYNIHNDKGGDIFSAGHTTSLHKILGKIQQCNKPEETDHIQNHVTSQIPVTFCCKSADHTDEIDTNHRQLPLVQHANHLRAGTGAAGFYGFCRAFQPHIVCNQIGRHQRRSDGQKQ